MDRRQADCYLKGLNKFGIRLRLEHTERLLSLLGDPHLKLRCIHVAGTNGKGSVCAYLHSILKEAGFKVGLYTSPHLYRLNERIKVNGKPISDAELARLATIVKPHADAVSRELGDMTFFEVTTAMAFLHFAETGVDYVVLETGLGGRLDATNVVNPMVSVITNVSREHVDLLGSDVRKIAREKAAIIKNNGLVVTAASGRALEVIEERCREKKAVLCSVGDEVSYRSISSTLERQEFAINFFGKHHKLGIGLLGRHQLSNATVAYAAVEMLKTFHGIGISEEAVSMGFLKARILCRIELVQKKPLVFLDGAHNPDGIRKLMEYVGRLTYKKLILVFGCSYNKEYRRMIPAAAKKADMVFVSETKLARPLDAVKLKDEFGRRMKAVYLERDVGSAVRKALSKAGEGDVVLITGSLYVAGEARLFWHKKL
jgi:dihydrofolate synthase/folylpolyglutamate synthase